MATKPPDDTPADGAADEPAAVDFDQDSGPPPRTLHDGFFKSLFRDPGNAAAVLQAIVPARVARHIDWSSLELQHASMVSEQFRQQHGDLLFLARLKVGGELFLWVLFEHQSTIDYWMSRRLAEYSLKSWQTWLGRHPDARRLPAILPVVLYQGREPWTAPTSFHDYFDLPDEVLRDLGEYLLSYRFVLDDLRVTEDEVIKTRPAGPVSRLALIAMKHGPAEELLGHLLDLHEDVRALMATERGRAALELILRYIWYVNAYIDRDMLMEHLVPVVGPELADTMLTYGQKLEQQGYDKGLEQGIEKGLEQGIEKGLEQGLEKGLANQRAFLRRLLEQRFGTLPGSITTRIEQADSDDIDRWGTRILTADSLHAVFAT